MIIVCPNFATINNQTIIVMKSIIYFIISIIHYTDKCNATQKASAQSEYQNC